MTTSIAERILKTPEGRTVTIEIHAPEPDPDPTGDWQCLTRIHGELDANHAVHGLDAFQALENATQFIRKTLDDSGLALTWAGGGDPGDHGFACTVPQFFGRAFAREIEDEIDRRIAAHKPPWAP
jgi:hypothetical protein